MKTLLATCIVCLLLLSWLPVTSDSAQEIKLQRAGKVQMLNPQNGDFRPFFRITLNLVNKDGSPAEIKLPGQNRDLKELIEISVDGGNPFHPLYVSGLDSTQTPIGREMMVLFDTSGSMDNPLPGANRSKFDTAKDAVRILLKNFQDKVDKISIVNFDSHDVVQTIERAKFVDTRAEAEAQIDHLPSPDGDTALYSAAQAALTVLEQRLGESKKSTPGVQRNFMLIILTDGKNDLGKSGGPGLLDGEEGLKTVEEKAAAVDVPIYTRGLGKPGEDINASALERMAHPRNNYRAANDASKLFEDFQVVEQLSTHTFNVTFAAKDHSDLRRLGDLTFRVSLNHPDGSLIKSGDIRWSCSQLTDCKPDDTLSPKEWEALIKSNDTLPPPNPWSNILRLVWIFALLSGSMAFLWFIPPRLLWPRPHLPYIPSPVGAVNLPRNLRTPRETASPPAPEASSERQENVRPGARNRLDKTRVITRDKPGN